MTRTALMRDHTVPTLENERAAAPAVVDFVIPTYNEAQVLAEHVTRLHTYLCDHFPFSWRITIADNASTDTTVEIAEWLGASLRDVRVLTLPEKGRGRALRAAWTANSAAVVAYMDVDLSTDLDALLPLIAPLVSGHSDIAIGSRLAPGSTVARRPKREFISRSYNLLLRAMFATHIRDAQCGFKAVRSDVANQLLPHIEDNGWFFDTELLLLAEHNGLRIHEVPVDWVDDPDTRVDISSTARADLQGAFRVFRSFLAGRGTIDFSAISRPRLHDDFGRQLVSFGMIGLTSTAISLAGFILMRPSIGAIWASILCVLMTFAFNTWANARFTLRQHHTRWRTAMTVLIGTLTVSTLALLAIAALGGGQLVEVLALIAIWLAASIIRLVLLRQTKEVSQP